MEFVFYETEKFDDKRSLKCFSAVYLVTKLCIVTEHVTKKKHESGKKSLVYNHKTSENIVFRINPRT